MEYFVDVVHVAVWRGRKFDCCCVGLQRRLLQPQLLPKMGLMVFDDSSCCTPLGFVLDLSCTNQSRMRVVDLRVYCHRSLFAVRVVN